VSAPLLKLLWTLVAALAMTIVSVMELRSGSAIRMFGSGDTERATQPWRFWFEWLVWALLTTAMWASCVRYAFAVRAARDPMPASFLEWFGVSAAVLLIIGAALAWSARHQLRYGWPGDAEAREASRRETLLRARIGAADPSASRREIAAVVDRMSLGTIARVAEHLEAQAPPRRLSLAVSSVEADLDR
jgi:hypothetical protein